MNMFSPKVNFANGQLCFASHRNVMLCLTGLQNGLHALSASRLSFPLRLWVDGAARLPFRVVLSGLVWLAGTPEDAGSCFSWKCLDRAEGSTLARAKRSRRLWELLLSFSIVVNDGEGCFEILFQTHLMPAPFSQIGRAGGRPAIFHNVDSFFKVYRKWEFYRCNIPKVFTLNFVCARVLIPVLPHVRSWCMVAVPHPLTLCATKIWSKPHMPSSGDSSYWNQFPQALTLTEEVRKDHFILFLKL